MTASMLNRLVILIFTCLSSASAYPDAAEAKRWVKIHNTYRCMHGQPYVGWSDNVAKVAYDYGLTLTSLVHSDAYSLQPPAGPAGENLAMGYPDLESAVGGWYEEVKDCNKLPGCDAGNGGAMVGHFTAMIWKGVTTIGCGINPNSMIYTCHYRSGHQSALGPWTDNMGGAYEISVPPPNGKTFAQCQAEAPDFVNNQPSIASLYPGMQQPASVNNRFRGGQGHSNPLFSGVLFMSLICLCYCLYTNVARRLTGDSYRVFPAGWHIETQLVQAGSIAKAKGNELYIQVRN